MRLIVNSAITALLLSAVATDGFAASEPARSVPFDRSSYFVGPNDRTSDDPLRIPLGPDTGAKKTLVIANARLFDGTGAPARAATITIVGDKIAEISGGDRGEWPKDAEVIDVAWKTVMPGLIDLHTHLTECTEEAGLPGAPKHGGLAELTLCGVEQLRYFIESGVTSVRDVASHGMAPIRLKQWVAQDRIPGPRVFPVGQLITGRGGHGDGGQEPRGPDDRIRVATGPDDWRLAVREQFNAGADLIKLASHYSPEEVRAAVDEAHLLGLRVTVDAETQYIEMAVDAGVDCVEHPLPRSDAVIRKMARQGIASDPTLVPYQYIIATDGGYFGSTSRRFTLTEDTIFATTRKMKDAGVKLGIGSDLVAGWYRILPDAYIQELRNFVRLGYTPSQTLVAATQTNAEILGLEDKLGTLVPGKLADLIVVDGTPDQDVEDLKKLDLVITGGKIRVRAGHLVIPRHEALPPPAPSASSGKHSND